MRIAVDYQSVHAKKTGIGVVTEETVRALSSEMPEAQWLLYRPAAEGDLKVWQRLAWENLTVASRLSKDRPDLFFCPGFSPPLRSGVPTVVTVHDLIGLAFPSNQRPLSRFYWSVWLPASVRRARRIIAVSEHTRKDLEKFLGIPPDRIRVVPNGVGSAFKRIEDPVRIESVRRRHGIKRRFLICVGSLEPRKNHLRLLKAYSRLKREGAADFMLVVAGKSAGTGPELEAFVRKEGLSGDVLFTGYVDESELICLYSAAEGYVMISLYEGFGLPVLEAMRCGLSGVVSDRTSLPEVAGSTAVYVDPDSTDAVAEGLSRYMRDGEGRRALSQAAYQRSLEFSYERAGKALAGIFRDEIKKN